MADLLKGVAAAARNPLAFVAYLSAIIAWAMLRGRVERNQNLLNRLTDIPASQRAQILRDEMGVWDAGDNLSAEQRIRARIHRYYFLAFLTLCAVIVVVFAIARFAYKPRPPVVDPEAIHKVILVNPASPPPDPELVAFTRKVELLDLGVERGFVIGNFGHATHSVRSKTGSCADYTLPFAKLIIFYDKQDEVTFFYILSTDARFKPHVLHWGGISEEDKKAERLGNFSFLDYSSHDFVATTGEAIQHVLEREPQTIWVNDGGNSIFPALYIEEDGGAPWSRRTAYLVWSSHGYSPSGSEDSAVKLVFGLEEAAGIKKDVWEGLSHDDVIKFNKLRGDVIPNGYAMAKLEDDSVVSHPINKEATYEGDYEAFFASCE